MLQMSNLAV